MCLTCVIFLYIWNSHVNGFIALRTTIVVWRVVQRIAIVYCMAIGNAQKDFSDDSDSLGHFYFSVRGAPISSSAPVQLVPLYKRSKWLYTLSLFTHSGLNVSYRRSRDTVLTALSVIYGRSQFVHNPHDYNNLSYQIRWFSHIRPLPDFHPDRM